MVSRFLRPSRLLHLPSILSSVADAYFWLVVVCQFIEQQCLRLQFIPFLFIIGCSIPHPNDGVTLPLRLPLVPPPLQILTCHQRQLWVDCCVPSSNKGHQRPRHHPSLFFMRFFLMQKTREGTMVAPNPTVRALHGPMGSRSTMSWGHRCSTHGDKGQSFWRVGCRWIIFGVCVFVVCVFEEV